MTYGLLLKEALEALNITSDTLRNAMTGRAVPKATTLNALEASRIAIASLTAAIAQEQEKGVVFQRSGVIPLNQHHSITWRAPLASVEAKPVAPIDTTPLTDKRIKDIAATYEVGTRASPNWAFAWHDFARAIESEVRASTPAIPLEPTVEWFKKVVQLAGVWPGDDAPDVFWQAAQKYHRAMLAAAPQCHTGEAQ